MGLVQIPAAPPRIQLLPAKVSGKAAESGSSAWATGPLWETQMRHQVERGEHQGAMQEKAHSLRRLPVTTLNQKCLGPQAFGTFFYLHTQNVVIWELRPESEDESLQVLCTRNTQHTGNLTQLL